MLVRRKLSTVALIPARAGSTRVPNKNIRSLNKHPLFAYTIAAALNSRVFSTVVVSTDSEYYADIARYYGAEVPCLRPAELATATSPDIEWVQFTLDRLKSVNRLYDVFCILRPTSPFRLPSTIQRAWRQFQSAQGIDSLRAVELCKQHPGKMWVVRGNRILPLLPLAPADRPWHSSPYQSLPEVYVQNASLEMAWSHVVANQSICGETVMPFFTKDYEGIDINQTHDWWYAEYLIQNGLATLPKIYIRPYEELFPVNKKNEVSH